MKRKWLTVGIILLFIGVAVAPSINFSVVKASIDNDFIEVTTQACGINGFGNTTVKLTREQYQNLELYLVDFRARLNQTSTREEAIPIFKEAVVELDKYGLLPKGMSIERAQRFITNSYQNKREMNILNRMNHYMQNIGIGNIDNAFCLVAGHTDRTGIIGLLPVLFIVPALIGFIISRSIVGHLLPILSEIFAKIVGYIALPLLFLGFISYFLPVTLGSVITFGFVIPPFAEYGHFVYYPSSGWIISFGILGAKGWDGPFYGNIYALNLILSFYIGIFGFIGLKIILLDNCFFLGSAFAVGIDDTQ